MTGHIYLIRNMINGKGYVGQTVRIAEDRLREHVSESRSGRTKMALHKAIQKYGAENFSVIELASAQEGVLLNELERHYIKAFSTLTSQNGYNISEGGKGRASGFTVSEETRRKQSDAALGRKAWNKGIPQSEDQRRRHSVAMTGRKQTAEHRQKISLKSRGRKLPGRVFSEEHKAKLSVSLMGNKRSIGRVVSQETREKMSLAHKGQSISSKGKPWSEARRAAQATRNLARYEGVIQ
jgi:group I intron endonuclease